MKIMRWTWIALKCGGIAVIAYVALGALGDLNPFTLVIDSPANGSLRRAS